MTDSPTQCSSHCSRSRSIQQFVSLLQITEISHSTWSASLRTLALHCSCFEDRKERSQALHFDNDLYGLQSMSSDVPEVRRLAAFVLKIRSCPEETRLRVLTLCIKILTLTCVLVLPCWITSDTL
jgi:hypothetical protein